MFYDSNCSQKILKEGTRRVQSVFYAPGMNRYIQSVIAVDLYQRSWCLNVKVCLISLCAYARLRDIEIYSGMSFKAKFILLIVEML